jgi:hypothetical protein
MTASEVMFLLFAVSLPMVVLLVIGRHIVSAFRSLKDKRFGLALLSALAIAAILLLFTGVGVLWFVHAVGHSNKEFWQEFLIVVLSTAAIYGGGYGLWRAARFLDSKQGKKAT